MSLSINKNQVVLTAKDTNNSKKNNNDSETSLNSTSEVARKTLKQSTSATSSSSSNATTEKRIVHSPWRDACDPKLTTLLGGVGLIDTEKLPKLLKTTLPHISHCDVQLRHVFFLNAHRLIKQLSYFCNRKAHLQGVNNYADDLLSLFAEWITLINSINSPNRSVELSENSEKILLGILLQSIIKGKTLQKNLKDTKVNNALTKLLDLQNVLFEVIRSKQLFIFNLPTSNVTGESRIVHIEACYDQTISLLSEQMRVNNDIRQQCTTVSYEILNNKKIELFQRRLKELTAKMSLKSESIFRLVMLCRTLTKSYRAELSSLRFQTRGVRAVNPIPNVISMKHVYPYDKGNLLTPVGFPINPTLLFEPPLVDNFLVATLSRLDLVDAGLYGAYAATLRKEGVTVNIAQAEIVIERLQKFYQQVKEITDSSNFKLPGKILSAHQGCENNTNRLIQLIDIELTLISQVNLKNPNALELLVYPYISIKNLIEEFMSRELTGLTQQLVAYTKALARSLHQKDESDKQIAYRKRLKVILRAIEKLVILFDDDTSEILYHLDKLFIKEQVVSQSNPKTKNFKQNEKKSKKSLAASSTKKTTIKSEPKPPPSKEKKTPTINIKEESKRLEHLAEKVVHMISANNSSQLSAPQKKKRVSNRNIKWRTLFSELIDQGWYMLGNTKGGHTQWKHSELGGRITVPRHGKKPTVSIGVAKNVREQVEQAKENLNDRPSNTSTKKSNTRRSRRRRK